MKKLTLITLAILSLSISAFGQIKVNSAGRSFFGTGTNTTSYGAININMDGATGGLAIVGNTGTPLRIYKYGDAGFINRNGGHNGIKINSNNKILISDSNIGSINWPSSASLNLLAKEHSVFWTRFEYTSNGGSALVSEINNLNSYPFVAYYLKGGGQPGEETTFRVKGDGTVYAKNGYLQLSDATDKTNIRNISSALNRLNDLQAISFNYNDIEEKKKSFATARMVETDSATLAAQIVNNGKGITAEVLQQMETEISRERIGLIAQDVEKIIPEVVRTLPDGKKGIMYTELIPLLIEGIKELKTIVDQQQIYIDQLISPQEINPKEIDLFSEESGIAKPKAYLSQNRPNPFNQQTEISYQLPEYSTAYLGVYNLSGMQIKKYPLYNQEGVVTISASELQPGIYIYSLIVDNQEIDSKRMVLTD